MWSKGAVVIIKHGDEAIADAVERGLDIREVDPDLKRDYTFLKRRTREQLKKDIEEAERKYGYNWRPPWWAKSTVEGFAFIVYGICVFIERYLRF